MPRRYALNSNVVHFIGIGGIGMSALARYFLSKGWEVSGSDLSPSSITDELKKEGARIHIGKHSANNLPKWFGQAHHKEVSLVIYNQAILKNNPELVFCEHLQRLASNAQRHFRILSYPEMVGELTHRYKTIAIAGAHGKSTTTAMTALILIEANLDPTVIVGTKLKQFGNSNFRKGKSEWLVLEADEWRGSFWHYSPFIGAITNIDKEHLDFYKNFSNVKKSFARFKKQCQHIVTHEKSQKIQTAIRKTLKIPGEHNVQNALLAYSIGKTLGIDDKIILHALSKYAGAWRRMEFRGYLSLPTSHIQPIPVYDDYAHHPTEIQATLAGLRSKYPKNALICVFQAHQLERLKLLYNGFKNAFKEADKVILLPTYQVVGREQKSKIDLSEKLAKDIEATYVKKPGKELKYVLVNLFATSNPSHPTSHILVMMGAGDIATYTDRLLA